MTRKPETILTMAGNECKDCYCFINPPVVHASTILFPTLKALDERLNPYGGYALDGTPTSKALESTWSELEGAAGTVITPSGLSALSATFSAVLKAGDDLLVPDNVYNPTRHFCDNFLKRWSITTRYYDPEIGAGISALIKPATRAILMETPGSNTMEIQDVPAIVKVAKKHDIITIIDNSWATPLFFNPMSHGIDIAVTAATKYVLGHSDGLMGLISASPRAWKMVKEYHKRSGLTAGPDDIYQALRGLRTMYTRLKHHEKAAFQIAKWLTQRPEVVEVLHPGLAQHPGHKIWKRDFSGSTGLFSFITEPFSYQQLSAFFDGLQLFGIGFSWGGYKSMTVLCDQSARHDKKRWAVDGSIIRLYIGLEAVDDLKEDLAAGFERMTARAD